MGKILVAAFLWVAFSGASGAWAQEKVLNVYGPWGPLGPMRECSEMFFKSQEIKVNVIAGPEVKWINQAQVDADIIFDEAEYMMSDFIRKYPALIDENTRTGLYVRGSGILVRKDNPKNIKSLFDLTRKGIKILDINGAGQMALWEDMAAAKELVSGIQKNIAVTVTTSAEAIELWKTRPDLDAWIAFETWHYRLMDVTDLVSLPSRDKVYRGTPIALTRNSKQKEAAQQFIDFLKTEKAHKIFQKWGWR
jgi:accessory colonization factor AcfC